MTDELIERSYRIFARYPRFDAPRDCTHCIDAERQRQMMAAPLRGFPSDWLGTLVSNSGTLTWGDEQDIKHFLPRVLEVLTAGMLEDRLDGSLLHGLQMVLTHFDWQHWPDEETACIDGFSRAIWSGFSRAIPTESDAWDTMSRVGEARDLLQAILEIHQGMPSWLPSWCVGENEQTVALCCHLVTNLVEDRPSPDGTWSEQAISGIDQWLRDSDLEAQLRRRLAQDTKVEGVDFALENACTLLAKTRRKEPDPT